MRAGRLLAAGFAAAGALGAAALLAAPRARDGVRDGLARGPALGLAASRIAPGTVAYTLEQGGIQIGFARSGIDTAGGRIITRDEIVTELPIGGKLNRVTGVLRAELTRELALHAFELAVESASGPLHVTGRPEGDTLLVLTVAANGLPADTQRVAIRGPLILPTVVPLAVALGDRPVVGRRYSLTTFDPLSLAPRGVRLTVRAESLFVLADSTVLDRATRRWRMASTRAIRAWQLAPDSGGGFSGWVAEDGRVVELDQPGGFVLRRTARALSEVNWALVARERPRGGPVDGDILESTAIAASAPLRRGLLSRLRVRLTNVDLDGFDVDGGRQRLRGAALTVTRDPLTGLVPGYALPARGEVARRYAAELAAEPLLQVNAPEIQQLAARIAGGEDDPVVVARRLTRWVHDSLAKDITIGVPNAVQVLATRNGDCNEHSQLFVALARAAGIPARGAAGLARVGTKFYYHAWPEVYLGRWVAVDPTFGEFPADAGHLRFLTGGPGRQPALLRLIGTLKIDVLESR